MVVFSAKVKLTPDIFYIFNNVAYSQNASTDARAAKSYGNTGTGDTQTL